MKDYYFSTGRKSTNVRVNDLARKSMGVCLDLLWRWAPGSARWLILRLFFSPRAHRIRPEEEACLKQGRPFQIKVHEKTLTAWRWGKGPAVLLVHGWSGAGAQLHAFVAPLVEAGYTAIAIDMPAHGASTGRGTSYFEFTDTLRTLLSKGRKLDIQGVIAHSFGASATINALAKEQVAINTVCIAPILRLRELLYNTFERFGLPQAIYSTIIGEFEQHFGYSLKVDNPIHLLDHLCGPLVIVHDENDRTVAFDDSAELSRNHAHITLVATRKLGHRRLLTNETVIRTCVEQMGRPNSLPLTVSKGDKNGIPKKLA